ncbi:MAG TPA: pyridoxal-dependent decarboxylase [Gemmatimonadaceae bacterium]|nr:pyridoxal-dependent decarboxylase [Gemmatimonadaceae bacterium]
MRRLGHQVTDLVAGHLASVRGQPAQHPLDRRTSRAVVALPRRAPELGTSFDAIVSVLRERVLPYHAREPHPMFLGYVSSSPTFPAIIGDWIATGFNFFAGVWSVAAGPNEVELTVLEWFRDWLGMPAGARGLLTSGGSNATLTAVVAARHAALGDRVEDLPRLTMYCSDQAHSSVARAAWIAGIPRDQVRAVASDDQFRLRVNALRDAIAHDRAAGLQPFLIVGSAGATNTGAVDPLHALADIAADEGLWYHIDAAYAGFSVLTGRGRALLSGIERADSVTLDPHKWLYVPFECGCLMVREPARLHAAFHIMADYLKDVQAQDEDVNFADYGEQLTRYSRAFKVWVSVNYFGLAAIRAEIERAMGLADLAERLVREAPDLEVLSPATFGVVCFRVHPPGMDDVAELDALNERVNAAVNGSHQVLMSSTRLRGAFSLRLCILNYRTTDADIAAVIGMVRTAGTA